MTKHAEKRRQLEEIFSEAADLPRDARDAFVRDRCGGDSQLRRAVEALLAHDEQAGHGFMSGVRPPPPIAHAAPDRLGTYRIVKQLGVGGMGVVYEAIQESPERAVALKVIRPGLISPQVLRRFAAESRVLGLLKHPGIAQVYEAGEFETPEGRQPFFAMELIVGEPLDRWCRKRSLDARARIELVAMVCDAVDHAHARGVVHRDLKPGNILVEDSGRPRILDFGVARLQTRDVAVTMATGEGQLVGTLPYMSPEQFGADPTAVGPRTDVYALGVVLYELLAGRLPLDVSDRPVVDAARVILETEPTHLGKISSRFAGDIETIVAKAMNKEPAQRYVSAAELAADLRRHLGDEPIMARPTSALGHFKKFARRNKALVGGAAATMVALVAGLAVSTFLAIEQSQQRELAEKATTKAAQNEKTALRQAYRASISAALALTKVRDSAAARESLESIPEGQRGWEWRHLNYVSNRSVATYPGDLKPSVIPVPSPVRGVYAVRSDGAMTFWDGKSVAPMFAAPTEVKKFDISRDESAFLFVLADELRLLERDGSVRWSKKGFYGIGGQSFRKDDARIVAADVTGGNVVELDARDGRLVRVVGEPFAGIAVAGYSPSSRYIAAEGRSLRVMDDSGVELRGAFLEQPAFAPDDTYLQGPRGSGFATLIDLATGSERGTVKVEPWRENSWVIGTHWVACFEPPGNVAVFDRRTLARTDTLMVGKGHVAPFFVDHDRRIGVVSWPGTLRLFDTAAAPQPWTARSGLDGVTGVAVSPDTMEVATCGWGTIGFWDRATGLRSMTHCNGGWWFRRLAYSPDGARVAAISNEGAVVTADHERILGDGERAGLRAHASSPIAWVSPEVFVVAGRDGGAVFVRGSGEITLIRTVPLPAAIVGLSAAKGAAGTGTVLASLDNGSVVQLGPEGDDLRTVMTLDHAATCAAGSADGTLLAAASSSGEVRVVNASTGETVSTAQLGGRVRSLAWLPDGSRLAATTGEQIIVLDPATGEDLVRFTLPYGSATESVVFTADGGTLLGLSVNASPWLAFETTRPADDVVEMRPLVDRMTLEVTRLRKLLLIGDGLIDAIGKNPELNDRERDVAARIARGEGPQNRWMNSEAWGAVMETNLSPEMYRRAVEVCRMNVSAFPGNAGMINTLGIALYRTGDYQGAYDAHTRSAELERRGDGKPHPIDLAMLAMSAWKLGRTGDAMKHFDQMTERMTEVKYATDQESLRFAAEARDLLKRPAAADPR